MSTQVSHLPNEIVVDEELALRAKSSESFDEFSRIVVSNREHLSAWLPWAENAPDESSVAHYSESPMKKENDEEVNWDIFCRGSLCGAIGLMKREETKTILEIGYWLAQEFNGRGIMTRCVNALVDVTFKQTDTPAIEIGCDKANLPSASVALRAGFTYHRDKEREPVARCETDFGHYFRLTRDEWLAR